MTIHASQVHLDMRVAATGVHAGGTTTWETPVPFYGTHAVVLSTGAQIALIGTPGGTAFTAEGDHAGEAILGTPFPMEIELPPPQPRDAQGQPLMHDALMLKRLTVLHTEPSGYIVRVAMDAPWSFNRDLPHAGDFDSDRQDRISFNPGAKSEQCRIVLMNNTWNPATIHGYELEAVAMKGSR